MWACVGSASSVGVYTGAPEWSAELAQGKMLPISRCKCHGEVPTCAKSKRLPDTSDAHPPHLQICADFIGFPS